MSSLLLGTISPARRIRNKVALGAVWMSVAIAAIPLVFVLAYLVQKGGGIVS